MPQSQPVAATEVAEAEYERFLDAMDLAEKLETKTRAMSDAERMGLDDARATLINAMKRGSLVISTKGEPIFTPQLGDTAPITFREPSGADLMAIDGEGKKLGDVARMFRIMASMSEQTPSRFAKMAMRDLRICQALAQLFLA